MSFELGVYSFGNTPRLGDGVRGATAQAIRDVLEAIKLAEEVGLDYFGVGEHHMRSMPLSSPTAVVNAAAASTSRIKLSTSVTVLSTDDPIRVFQQLATAAAIAPGRIEAVAGRGSSTITFPLFDYDEHHGVRRYIGHATPAVLDPQETPTPVTRLIGFTPRSFMRRAYDEITGLVANSGLDWTIIRFIAPRNTPKQPTVRVGFSGTDKLGFAVSRADIAALTAAQVDDTTYIHRAPAISN